MKRFEDVKSDRRFTAVDLRGLRVAVSQESLLALWFFVARHGAPCAAINLVCVPVVK